MKTPTIFLQVTVDRVHPQSGRPWSLNVAKITKNRPKEPVPGALVVEVSVDVPLEFFGTQAVEAVVEPPRAVRAVAS